MSWRRLSVDLRHRAVLGLLATGLTRQQIADVLDVPRATLEKRAATAIAYAERHGLDSSRRGNGRPSTGASSPKRAEPEPIWAFLAGECVRAFGESVVSDRLGVSPERVGSWVDGGSAPEPQVRDAIERIYVLAVAKRLSLDLDDMGDELAGLVEKAHARRRHGGRIRALRHSHDTGALVAHGSRPVPEAVTAELARLNSMAALGVAARPVARNSRLKEPRTP